MLEVKGLHSPRPYRGLEYYHDGNLLSKYGRNPIGQSENISFDSQNNHFFQMFKTNARKGFFADISVFFAVKWPLKHNHQAASSHCLWFKSYCSSRERSKCRQDTLKSQLEFKCQNWFEKPTGPKCKGLLKSRCLTPVKIVSVLHPGQKVSPEIIGRWSYENERNRLKVN